MAGTEEEEEEEEEGRVRRGSRESEVDVPQCLRSVDG
jgi:hypothetical protein